MCAESTDLKILNHAVCQQHTYFYTSQGQYTFCVNHNEIEMLNLELLRAIGKLLCVPNVHAWRKLPAPVSDS